MIFTFSEHIKLNLFKNKKEKQFESDYTISDLTQFMSDPTETMSDPIQFSKIRWESWVVTRTENNLSILSKPNSLIKTEIDIGKKIYFLMHRMLPMS